MREPDRIIRLKTVLARTGLSRSTIYRKIAEGTFPVSSKSAPTGALEIRHQPLDRRSRIMASETRVRRVQVRAVACPSAADDNGPARRQP